MTALPALQPLFDEIQSHQGLNHKRGSHGPSPQPVAIDPTQALASATRLRDLLVAEKAPTPLVAGTDLRHVDEKQFRKAERRLQVVLDFLKDPSPLTDIRIQAQKAGIHISTFYRLLHRYACTAGRVEDFLPVREKPPRMRLPELVESIIEESIQTHYLRMEKPKVASLWRKVRDICLLKGQKPPHQNTIRLRVSKLDLEKVTRARLGVKKARDRFAMVGQGFTQNGGPMSLVQIDHTPVDVIVLDEETRRAIGRPYVTIVLDTYSRMVLGFCLTLDEPSSLSVGIALQHAILAKKPWLDEIGVDAEWPCQGLFACIFVDNAFEFRGNMLRRACLNWQIDLQWRPLKRPEYGGHIERFMRTLAQAVHEIPGTTFSNTQEKGDYDSANSACMTLRELEAWLAIWVTKVYHLRAHQGLGGRNPLRVWEEGKLRAEATEGKQKCMTVSDPLKVRMDFLPFVERTIQQYGIKMFGEFYYQDFLQHYVHVIDPEDSRRKRTFTIRYDPRDMSRVYFYDQRTSEYYPVPWRDPSRPPCSLWELRARARWNRENAASDEDEMTAVHARKELEDRIVAAKSMTQHQRRKFAKKKCHETNNVHHLVTFPKLFPGAGLPGDPDPSPISVSQSMPGAQKLPDWTDLKPFNEIE